MGRTNRKKTDKRSHLGKSTIQIVPSSTPTTPSSPQSYSPIDWKKINFVQFITIFSFFLFIMLFIIIPSLNEYSLLRPHANALAQIFSSAFISLATILSAGLIYFQKVKVWQRFKSRQLIFDAGISILAILVVLASIIQFPPSSTSHSNLSRIPYPPYQQGILVLEGMPSSQHSSRYYWVQNSNGQRSCKFVGSSYHVTSTKQDNLAICELANADFHNFAFEIDMSFLKPGIGSIFFQSTDQTSYQLDIQSIGDYAELSFGIFSGSKGQQPSYRALIQPTLIVTQDRRPMMFSPGYTNRIAVVLINQTINIYVNGMTTKNWQKTDDSSSHGSIAVAAYTPSGQHDTQTEIIFSNSRAWTF